MAPRVRLPVIDTPAVEHMPFYVRGFPMHMALTVTLLPNATERRLPRLDIHGAADVRATFTREGDGAVTRGGRDLGKSLPQPSLGEADDSSIDHVDLDPGEPRRMLFDAAVLQADAPLSAGRYRVELTYHQIAAPPFDIVVRDATREESQALAEIERLGPDWLITEPSGAQAPPISAEDPMCYLRVLHYLYTTPTSPAALDPHVLDVLDDGFYAPEAALVRFELARLRADGPGQDSAAATIQSQFPALLPALRELRRSSGAITLNREFHQLALAERHRR